MMHVWGWEIPIYLFLGGLVAGLMIISGIRLVMMRPKERHPMVCCTIGPLVALALLSMGMLTLFLDLSHKLFVWRLYLTFEPTSPMSWGSWILLLVYPALIANAIAHLPEAIPALAKRFPILVTWSDFILARPRMVLGIGLSNMLVGIGLGIYTGILLNTMVARPLWNSAILGPLFLFSGLSAGAAMLHLAAVLRQDRPAPQGAIGGAFAALVQPLGARAPDKRSVDGLIRFDLFFLVVEAILIALLIINLHSSSAAHGSAARLLMSGPYALPFWGVVVGLGVAVPIVWQALELSHRVRHTVVPALLVLVGGFTLRWVMVNAGQLSHIAPVISLVH